MPDVWRVRLNGVDSHVVVDVCSVHGTWFDKDELRCIIEFIQGGDFDKVRAMEMRELERQRRALEASRNAGTGSSTIGVYHDSGWPGSKHDAWTAGISAAASVVKLLLR